MKKLIFLYLFFFSLFFQLSYGQGDDCITNDCCGDGTYWSEADARCIVAFYGDMDVDGYIGTTDLLDFLSVFGTSMNFDVDDGCDPGIILGCMIYSACNYDSCANQHDGSCFWPNTICGCYELGPDPCGNCLSDNISCFQQCGDDITHNGQHYSTVEIDGQCWFADDLRYYYGFISDPISTVGSSGSYAAYYFPGNPIMGPFDPIESEPDFVNGLLYNHGAVTTTDVCPSNWHIPSAIEFATLINYAGGNTNAGLQLKSTDWSTNPGIDSHGFSAGPSGNMNNAQIEDVGEYTWYRTTTYGGIPHTAKAIQMSNSGPECIEVVVQNYRGMSVRCIQD